MKKVLIGQIFHETNTFSTVKTDQQSFQAMEWLFGEEIIKRHEGTRFYIGGMIEQAKQEKIELIPLFSANATPSGTITKETYDVMRDHLIDAIRKQTDYDGICLSLHGAGVVEGIDDLEGELLKEIRSINPTIPIVATLDLHANMTEEMVKHADILLGVNFYPHTDAFERGQEAIKLLKQMLEGQFTPKMSLVKLPLMIPTSTTYHSPAKDMNEYCWCQEAKESVIDCTFFHGFSQSDIPHTGVSVLTITKNDQTLADQVAEDVGQYLWNQRQKFFKTIYSPEEGIKEALATKGKPIIINETSDNPGGGTPGDGTYLLRAMIERDVQDACFGILCDPEVATLAHEKGEGAIIHISLGGKTDDLHGDPIETRAKVKTLSMGQFKYTSPMLKGLAVDLGKSACLQIGQIDVIVTSTKEQVFDEQIFILHGIDVTKKKIVALKSAQHFRAAFEPISQRIITVDSKGLSSSKISNFNYKHIKRPIYPLDEEVSYNI